MFHISQQETYTLASMGLGRSGLECRVYYYLGIWAVLFVKQRMVGGESICRGSW